jgi:hypothetical protein
LAGRRPMTAVWVLNGPLSAAVLVVIVSILLAAIRAPGEGIAPPTQASVVLR